MHNCLSGVFCFRQSHGVQETFMNAIFNYFIFFFKPTKQEQVMRNTERQYSSLPESQNYCACEAVSHIHYMTNPINFLRDSCTMPNTRSILLKVRDRIQWFVGKTLIKRIPAASLLMQRLCVQCVPERC